MHLCSDDYDFTTRAKLAWIPGLLTLGSQNWKTVPDYYLRKFGGLNVLLRCKYNVKDIKSIPLFNQNILVYFNEFKALYNFDQAQDIILFNNKEIIVDSKGLVQKRYPVNSRSLGQHQSTNVLPRIYK